MEELTKEVIRICTSFLFGLMCGGVLVFILFYTGHIKILKGGDWIAEGFEDRITEYEIQKISKEE